VAKSPKKISYEKLAPKSKTNSLNLIARVLIFVGKPFYFVITRSFLGLILFYM
jgi:hypothetical protein